MQQAEKLFRISNRGITNAPWISTLPGAARSGERDQDVPRSGCEPGQTLRVPRSTLRPEWVGVPSVGSMLTSTTG